MKTKPKTKPGKGIKKRKVPSYRDVPLSGDLRQRIRALQNFAQCIDKAATDALQHGYLHGAGSLFYFMNDALEDLAKSSEFPIADGIFDAAKGALGYAITKAQNESKLYQQGHAGIPFINYGPNVGGRLTRVEANKAFRDWLNRFCPTARLYDTDDGHRAGDGAEPVMAPSR